MRVVPEVQRRWLAIPGDAICIPAVVLAEGFAATALAWQDLHPDDPVILVTDNLGEFERVPGLRVESWVG